VLVSTGVIIAFLLAVFVIGWFIGRLRQRCHEQSGEE
jgi:biotin transporter BioY